VEAVQLSPVAEVPWFLLESAALGGERVLILTNKTALAKARSAHPDLAVFLEPEIDELLAATAPGEGRNAILRAVVFAKKQFKGWVVKDPERQHVPAVVNTGAREIEEIE
jgi:hypothetical protein